MFKFYSIFPDLSIVNTKICKDTQKADGFYCDPSAFYTNHVSFSPGSGILSISNQNVLPTPFSDFTPNFMP